MSKIDVLKENGTFNAEGGSVKADDFLHGIFFDPNDLMQVKYEMLRSVDKKELSISEASEKYGLSRQTYYVTKSAFERGGLAGLIPQKTGPKGGSKLNEEGLRFIDSYLSKHPGASPREVNAAMAAGTGITVHDRTVARYLSKKRQGSR